MAEDNPYCFAVGQSAIRDLRCLFLITRQVGVNLQQRLLADNRRVAWCRSSAEYRKILNDYLLRIARASMRDVTLGILNSLRIKFHIRRPLNMHSTYQAGLDIASTWSQMRLEL